MSQHGVSHFSQFVLYSEFMVQSFLTPRNTIIALIALVISLYLRCKGRAATSAFACSSLLIGQHIFELSQDLFSRN